MSIELRKLQNHQYEVVSKGRFIGTIILSRNSFHAGNLYLQLEFSAYNIDLGTELFYELWKAQKEEKRFQIMCDSSEAELIRFIEAAGFACKRKCYELEVAESAWKKEQKFLAEIQQYKAGAAEYETACELLYYQYAIKHEAINPLTASYTDFLQALPKQIYAETSDNQIQNFAFVEENEIAYVGSVNTDTYPLFLASLVKQLFSEYDTICFEADDTDRDTMQLKDMFETEEEESFNTYIMERTKQ